MTYTPLWTERASKIRESLQRLDTAELSLADMAMLRLGKTVRTGLQGDFPDVAPELLGWILLDLASNLKLFSPLTEEPGNKMLAPLFASGKALLEGEGQ